MSINWNNIRSFEHSQNEAFEELVCQLARNEEIQNKQKFVRKGKPDAGVECFWILNNDDEWAWQAKYFTSSLDKSQWDQLDQSVKTVLNRHPNLKKYYIAIPNDPPDARLPDQKSMLDKWDERVQQWKGWASDKGLVVDFVPWWSSDLIARLSKTENQGLTYFWFHKEEFTDNWFLNNTEQSILDLGNRYTPNFYDNLNVAVEISDIFKGLSRGQALKNKVAATLDDLLRQGKRAIPSDNALINEKERLTKNLDDLETLFISVDFGGVEEIPIANFNQLLTEANSTLKAIRQFYVAEEQNLRQKQSNTHTRYQKYGAELNDVFNAEYAIDNSLKVFSSDELALANNPYLILKGEAGIGKSHLLADVITKRNEEGLQSLFLLGQHFVTEEDPWTQIKKRLDVNCSSHEFFGALNAKAEASKNRIILFIDAINEGKGRYFWPDHIRGFVQNIKKYPWLGLVLSVRSTYANLLVPEDLFVKNEFIRATHFGFSNIEYEASKIFFDNFGIELPSVPLLHPDFQNPLFLLLFCEGLNKRGYSRIPEGLQGITSIIDFFIDSVNQKLSRPNQLNYPADINVVEKAIDLIISKKFNEPSNVISYEDAFIALNPLLNTYGIQPGLLDSLISEGVFSKNLFRINGSEEYKEGIYFSYERFEDHMMVKFLLEKHPDVEGEFKEGGIYYQLFEDSSDCYRNKGILEALSIQIPELTGSELFSYASHIRDVQPVVESFVKSLLWRNIKQADQSMIDYINKEVFSCDETEELFLDTIIALCSNPAHFFNGNFLHKNLYRKSLAKRDGWWTVYISGIYDISSSIQRLVDWARNDSDKTQIAPESIKLSAITLAWLFTSTDRNLRDEATKALVCLLKDNINILIDVLKMFKGVNDPYVYERLFATAYGCALLTTNQTELKPLSSYIYQLIFNIEDEVYPHILLRDYARGVIEFTHHIFKELDFDIEKSRPPYKSDFPTQFPTNEELDNKYKIDFSEEKKYLYSQNDILSSMMTEYGRGTGCYGDFGRYTFQSALSSWDVNPDKLSNIAVEWIFEKYGYDAKLHGVFDRNVGSGRGRTSIIERIGKKYQWIALHEILARVSDNCAMKNQGWHDDKTEPYQGAWQTTIRDIDPSMLLGYSEQENEEAVADKWWSNEQHSHWDLSDKEWIHATDDLPSPERLISVTGDNNEEWLVLEGYPTWEEPKKLGKEKVDTPHKMMWYHIKSYIVSEDKSQSFFEWAIQQAFMKRRMPEPANRYPVFDREYYWSPAYKYFNNADFDGLEHHEIDLNDLGQQINVTLTTSHYFWGGRSDGSINILKPSTFIYNGMGLKATSNPFKFNNNNNELCCFDPSIKNQGQSYLLINKRLFLDYLKSNNLNVIWTILGRKYISGRFHFKESSKHLEISGAYRLNGEAFEGKINTKKIP